MLDQYNYTKPLITEKKNSHIHEHFCFLAMIDRATPGPDGKDTNTSPAECGTEFPKGLRVPLGGPSKTDEIAEERVKCESKEEINALNAPSE